MKDVYAGDEDAPVAAGAQAIANFRVEGDADPTLLGRIAAVVAQANGVPQRLVFERDGATCSISFVLPVGHDAAADLIARKLAQITSVVGVAVRLAEP